MSVLDRLTDRQAEFLRHQCAGLSFAEIAHAMGISLATAKGYVSTIRTRLGSHADDDVCRSIEPMTTPPEPVITPPAVAPTPVVPTPPVLAAAPPALSDEQRAAMRLRRQGLTYPQIAQRLGLSRSMAAYAVHSGTLRWHRVSRWTAPSWAAINELLEAIPLEELEQS